VRIYFTYRRGGNGKGIRDEFGMRGGYLSTEKVDSRGQKYENPERNNLQSKPKPTPV
jgi:hypothetical protein